MANVDILLVKAPRGQWSYFREGSESLALGYLGAVLRANSYNVTVIDAQLEGLSFAQTIERCNLRQYDIIGFTIADPSFIKNTFRLANCLRGAQARAHFTIGGYSPTFHYKEFLEECKALDSVVLYEGEDTIIELVESVQNGFSLNSVLGLAYRKDNLIICNEIRPLRGELDSLPFPERDYTQYIRQHLSDTGVISIAGSRGCYANCGFCSIRQFYGKPKGSSYRLRSVKNVADEIEMIVKNHGVCEFLLIDDIFTLPGIKGIQRIKEFQYEFNKRNLKVMLSISDRADNIYRPLYDKVYDLGVRQIMVGVEATNEDILKYFNKQIDIEDVRNAINALDELGIDTTITYINFTPKTTLEILRENLDNLLSLKVNYLLGFLNRLQVYVGTQIAQDMIEQGIVHCNFPDFKYRIPDDRVETVYEIYRQTLSPFLEISYEIMKLERMFRLKRFQLEKTGGNVDFLIKGRQWFKSTCNTIMEEAAEILRCVIDNAEKNNSVRDRFIRKVRRKAKKKYKLWYRELQLYRSHSSLFEERDCVLIN